MASGMRESEREQGRWERVRGSPRKREGTSKRLGSIPFSFPRHRVARVGGAHARARRPHGAWSYLMSATKFQRVQNCHPKATYLRVYHSSNLTSISSTE
jgi:hypothetical protein